MTVVNGEQCAAAPGQAAEAPGAAQPRSSWPRCRGTARSTGERCKARGDGLRGLCKNHTGATLGGWREPLPTFEVRITPSGIWVIPSRPARTWRKSPWPQQVSWAVAVRLVTSGQVTRGLVHRKAGASFLRELLRCGVRVLRDGPSSELVRSVAFEVPDIAAATLLAKRRKVTDHG